MSLVSHTCLCVIIDLKCGREHWNCKLYTCIIIKKLIIIVIVLIDYIGVPMCACVCMYVCMYKQP